MKKLKFLTLIALLILVVVTLSSCSDDASIPYKKTTATGPTPDVTEYNTNISYFSYVVDNNTNVVYLKHVGFYNNSCGLTVMLNADGTPVTRDQLGLN